MRFHQIRSGLVAVCSLALLLDTAGLVDIRQLLSDGAAPKAAAASHADAPRAVLPTPAPIQPTPAPTPAPTPVPKLTFPEGRPKALIHIMVQDPNLVSGKDKSIAKKRMVQLKKTLGLFDKNFNSKFHYPLVFFVNQGFTDATKTQINSFTTSATTYLELHFKPPPNISSSELTTVVNGCHRGVGYKHMCRFHAAKIYDHPIFDGVEYAWRIDDDSCIFSKIEDDVFSTMAAGKYLYGFHGVSFEMNSCTKGLWDTVRSYIKERGLKPAWFDTSGENLQMTHQHDFRESKSRASNLIFYNNFEISDVRFWKSKKYQDYFEYIENAKGIYTGRWGDAPIKTLALQLFVPEDKIHCFKDDIKYAHPKSECDFCETAGDGSCGGGNVLRKNKGR